MKMISIIEDTNSDNSLTKQEKRVKRFLLKNIFLIPEMTASKVADETYCTTTTVNRLCKKMGFNGYSELKVIAKYEIKMYASENEYNNSESNITIDRKKIIFFIFYNITNDVMLD